MYTPSKDTLRTPIAANLKSLSHRCFSPKLLIESISSEQAFAVKITLHCKPLDQIAYGGHGTHIRKSSVSPVLLYVTSSLRNTQNKHLKNQRQPWQHPLGRSDTPSLLSLHPTNRPQTLFRTCLSCPSIPYFRHYSHRRQRHRKNLPAISDTSPHPFPSCGGATNILLHSHGR
jgi:hypothetical protein